MIKTLAQLTLTRLVRGKTLWIAIVVALLPIVFAAIRTGQLEDTSRVAGDVLSFVILLVAVLPAVLVAGSVGEDIEDRTATYLWSRPVAREAVIAGKLVALVPITAVIVVVSWYAGARVGSGVAPSPQSLAGVAAGVVASSLAATGIATLVPKHGTALTVVYMLLFDLPVGVLPASLRYLSITHLTGELASVGAKDSPAVCAIALAIVGAIWLVVGILRIRRMEI
jgi:ABC-type transport system involved in multi-copper enzyme maturation permease subunit